MKSKETKSTDQCFYELILSELNESMELDARALYAINNPSLISDLDKEKMISTANSMFDILMEDIERLKIRRVFSLRDVGRK